MKLRVTFKHRNGTIRTETVPGLLLNLPNEAAAELWTSMIMSLAAGDMTLSLVGDHAEDAEATSDSVH